MWGGLGWCGGMRVCIWVREWGGRKALLTEGKQLLGDHLATTAVQVWWLWSWACSGVGSGLSPGAIR